MGDRLRVGKPSQYVTSHPGQLSLAIPSWVGAMSTSESWDVNRLTARCTSPVSVVWQCKLVSGWGLRKRSSTPSYGPYGSGRTSYTHILSCSAVTIAHRSRLFTVNALYDLLTYLQGGPEKIAQILPCYYSWTVCPRIAMFTSKCAAETAVNCPIENICLVDKYSLLIGWKKLHVIGDVTCV